MRGLGLLFVLVMFNSGDGQLPSAAEMRKQSMISSLSFAEKYRVNRTLPGTSGIFNKPYLIEDGTCIKFSNLPCCKRLINLYNKNLGSENRYEYEYPECRHDGYYMSKQCTNFHSTPTDCKCVDEIGKELMKLDSFNEPCHEEDCQKPCPRIRRFIGRICASDGSTYWNKCTFEHAKCKAKLGGVTLTVKNNGPCNSKHPGETESKHEESDWELRKCASFCIELSDRPCCKQLVYLCTKNYGMPGWRTSSEYEYPECRPDGYYLSKQCSNWGCKCVDEKGEDLMKLDSFDEDCPKERRRSEKEKQYEEISRPLDRCSGDDCKCPAGMTGAQPFCRPVDPVSPGQLMLTWMKTTIETLMELELELEHGAHGPSKPSRS